MQSLVLSHRVPGNLSLLLLTFIIIIIIIITICARSMAEVMVGMPCVGQRCDSLPLASGSSVG